MLSGNRLRADDELLRDRYFDGLSLGSYTVHETVPTGYHIDANDKSVTVDNVASCTDAT
jgi:hypothetical protein